jgi:hypothetical protein
MAYGVARSTTGGVRQMGFGAIGATKGRAGKAVCSNVSSSGLSGVFQFGVAELLKIRLVSSRRTPLAAGVLTSACIGTSFVRRALSNVTFGDRTSHETAPLAEGSRNKSICTEQYVSKANRSAVVGAKRPISATN